MSLQESPNQPENDTEKIPMNGDNSNENEVKIDKNNLKPESIVEGPSIMKTRSSKRTSDENTSKSNKEIIESKEKDSPEEVISSDDEPKTEVLNGSNGSTVDLEKSIEESNYSEENDNQTEENSPVIEDKQQNIVKEEFILDSETFMEPLVLQADEPCPELEFEESSDKESEKHSPVLSRCITRRSQNRKIPTPNTPRILCDPEPEKDSDSEKGSKTPLPGTSRNFNLDETDNSSANASLTVQVGGNDTRTDFSEGESDLLQSLKNRRSNSSYHYLSSRKSIRSLKSDLHSKSLRDSLHRSNMRLSSSLGRDSIERAPSVKRKDRSETPENRKKVKTDSTGFLSKLSSPLMTLKNKFSAAPCETSTPKLTSYRDEKNHIDGDFFDRVEMPQEMLASQNKWCEIM